MMLYHLLAEEWEMDFFLRYRGPLPTCSRANSRSKEKHNIRSVISPQLEDLWKQAPELGEFRPINNFPTYPVKGCRVDAPSSTHEFAHSFYNVQFKECLFTPLVIRPMGLLCQLDIKFLRREKPGSIIQGGDLDNRIKTLFDGLRIPLSDQEATEYLSGGERFFCLLEDDALITKITIETGQLYGPLNGGEEYSDVDVTIHVIVRVGQPMLINMGWI